MATPNINTISLNFAQRINDSRTSAGVEFTAGTENGVVLTALQRMTYINEAMLELIRNSWEELSRVTGREEHLKEKFCELFPELVDNRTITFAGGAYTIANPNLDFFELLGARITPDNICAVVGSKHLFQIYKTGKIPQKAGSATEPLVVEISKQLIVFPSAFNASAAEITILKLPVNPTDGSYLTQGGSYDSPFYQIWNTKIAQIAEQLYLSDIKVD